MKVVNFNDKSITIELITGIQISLTEIPQFDKYDPTLHIEAGREGDKYRRYGRILNLRGLEEFIDSIDPNSRTNMQANGRVTVHEIRTIGGHE